MNSSDARDPNRGALWARAAIGWGLGDVSLESTRSWWVDRDKRFLWRMTGNNALERRSIEDIDGIGEVLHRHSLGDFPAVRVDFLGRARPVAIVSGMNSIEQWTIGATIERRVLITLDESYMDDPEALGLSVSADGTRLLVSSPRDRGLLFELTADDELELVASIEADWVMNERFPTHALVGDNIAVVEGDDLVLRTVGGVELARVRGLRATELHPIDDHRVLVDQIEFGGGHRAQRCQLAIRSAADAR